MTLSQGAILLLAWRQGRGLSRGGAAKVFRADRPTYERWETGAGIPATRYAVAIEDETGIQIRSWLRPATEQPQEPAA